MLDRACVVSYKENPDVNKTNKTRLVYREEVIMGSSDMKSIYIFSTNHPTEFRLPHLMTDHNYDMSQAMQNMGYNQGTNLGYYVGAETLKKAE